MPQYRTVHAYIPMVNDGVRKKFIEEDNPVAYLDQMRAKRVADAARKRTKRRNHYYQAKFIVIRVTVK